MCNLTPHIRPQTVADYLWHRLQIQPGQALCLALGQPESRDNHEALIVWTRDRLEGSPDAELVEQISMIETDLCECLQDAGLVGDTIELQPVPDRFAAGLFKPTGNRTGNRTAVSARRRPAHASQNNIITFAGRTHHD